jgi:hypothetical protein
VPGLEAGSLISIVGLEMERDRLIRLPARDRTCTYKERRLRINNAMIAHIEIINGEAGQS